MSSHHSCMTCKWARVPDARSELRDGLEAECHRYPPQMTYTGEPDSYCCTFPAVGYENGCGEWAADEEDE